MGTPSPTRPRSRTNQTLEDLALHLDNRYIPRRGRCEMCGDRLAKAHPRKHYLCGPRGQSCHAVTTRIHPEILTALRHSGKLLRGTDEIPGVHGSHRLPLGARTQHFVLLGNIPLVAYPAALKRTWQKLIRREYGVGHLFSVFGVVVRHVEYLYVPFPQILLSFRDRAEADLAVHLVNWCANIRFLYHEPGEASRQDCLQATLLDQSGQEGFAANLSRQGERAREELAELHMGMAWDGEGREGLFQAKLFVTASVDLAMPQLMRAPTIRNIYFVDWEASLRELRRWQRSKSG